MRRSLEGRVAGLSPVFGSMADVRQRASEPGCSLASMSLYPVVESLERSFSCAADGAHCLPPAIDAQVCAILSLAYCQLLHSC